MHKLLDILIVFHVCSLLMFYDTSNMSLGDTEAIVSYNQSREIYYNLSLGQFDPPPLWSPPVVFRKISQLVERDLL